MAATATGPSFLAAAKQAAKSKAWNKLQNAKDGFDDTVNVPDGEYICKWGTMTCKATKDGKATVEFVAYVKDGEHATEKLRVFFYDIFDNEGAAERLGKVIKRLGYDASKLKPEQLISIEKELNAEKPDVRIQVQWKDVESKKTGKTEKVANVYLNGFAGKSGKK